MSNLRIMASAGIVALALVWAGTFGLTALARADWMSTGVRAFSIASQQVVSALPDGLGGVYVDADDLKDFYGVTGSNVRIQHLSGSGAIYGGWSSVGVSLSTSDPIDDYVAGACVNTDGSISASVTTYGRFWIKRVSGDGQFTPSGVFGPIATNDLDYEFVAPTQDGGNLVVWDDYSLSLSGGGHAFIERLGSDCAPSPGWPVDGRTLFTESVRLRLSKVIPDPAGGAWIAYSVFGSNAFSSTELIRHFVRKIRDDGTIDSAWAGGRAEFAVTPAHGYQDDVVPDGLGGAYCVWEDGRAGVGLSGYGFLQTMDIYMTHFLADGSVAPGWTADGLPVCTAPDFQEGPVVAVDGAGGAYVAWGLTGGQGNGIHAQHILSSGAPAPGWPVNGKQVFGPLSGYQDFPVVAPDRLGGLFVTAKMYPAGMIGSKVYLQHMTFHGDFDATWSAGGYAADTTATTDQAYPALAGAEPGAVFLAWDRNEDAYVQKFVVGGVVATQLALTLSESFPDHVALAWTASGDRVASATVQRRAGDGEWRALADIAPDGQGRFTYDDHDVTAGARLGYRLTWMVGTTILHSSETLVSVPMPYRFALAGARPNPATRRQLNVAFTLAESGSATLTMYDVNGRRVSERSVSDMGVGDHTLNLGADGRLSAGIYWLRLAQGSKLATARIVVVE